MAKRTSHLTYKGKPMRPADRLGPIRKSPAQLADDQKKRRHGKGT